MENQNIDIEKLKQDITKTLEDLKRANAEMEAKIKEAESALNQFPDPAGELDTDDQEIETLESASTDEIDSVMEEFANKVKGI